MQNRDVAMNILRAKLVQRQLEERQAKLAEVRGVRQANEWGSQIRSYVLQPYTLVKDNRTKVETGNALQGNERCPERSESHRRGIGYQRKARGLKRRESQPNE